LKTNELFGPLLLLLLFLSPVKTPEAGSGVLTNLKDVLSSQPFQSVGYLMVFTNIRNPLISKHQALFKSLAHCGTPPRKILQLSLSPSHSLMTLQAPQTHLPPNNQNGALAISSFHITS